MLRQRVATAIVGVPIIFLLIRIGGPWYTAALAAVIAAATLEFQAIQHQWFYPLPVLMAAIGAAMVAGASVGAVWLVWFTFAAIVLPLVWVTLFHPVEAGLEDWLWAIGGALYVGFLGAHFQLLRDLGARGDWVFLAVLGTYATDTAAYFVGRAVGRHRMAPRISPGKTWEGTAGGYAAGFGAVLLFNYYLGLRLEAVLILPLAALVPLAAILGDLCESMMKRGLHVKDTSRLIPGHGGIVDRMDSLLFAIPVVYYFATWVVP